MYSTKDLHYNVKSKFVEAKKIDKEYILGQTRSNNDSLEQENVHKNLKNYLTNHLGQNFTNKTKNVCHKSPIEYTKNP